MNKEEIEKDLIKIQAQINACVTMKVSFENRIKELEKQLAEAEKPKLRHTDFGYSTAKIPFIMIKDKVQWLSPEHCIVSGISPDNSTFTEGVFFNLLDLMKDWDKDFKEFVVFGQYNFTGFIPFDEPDKIRLKIEGGESTFTLPELKEIWLELGKGIAYLKRNLK